MRRMKTTMLLLALLMTPLFAPAAGAQFDTATVVGTVRDDSNAVVPGATITLTNLDTGIGTTRITDANGTYEFVTVRAGRYKIAAELQGFSTATADDLQVAVGARQRVELQLRPGNLTE